MRHLALGEGRAALAGVRDLRRACNRVAGGVNRARRDEAALRRGGFQHSHLGSSRIISSPPARRRSTGRRAKMPPKRTPGDFFATVHSSLALAQ